MITTVSAVESVILALCNDLDHSVHRNAHWRETAEEDLWVELVGCILGSQVSWEHAKSALDQLHSTGLLDTRRLLINPTYMEDIICKELEKPIYAPMKIYGSRCKYRFPRAKARQICRTATNIYDSFETLSNMLRKCDRDYEARVKLIDTCCGIGPKQASLFLRNIGFSDRLAILDYHVLKFMEKKGLIPIGTQAPTSRRHYLELEVKFSQYADEVGVASGKLDVAIWTVMRMAEVR